MSFEGNIVKHTASASSEGDGGGRDEGDQGGEDGDQGGDQDDSGGDQNDDQGGVDGDTDSQSDSDIVPTENPEMTDTPESESSGSPTTAPDPTFRGLGSPIPLPPFDICGDGIDNNNDGQIDEDCPLGAEAVPKPSEGSDLTGVGRLPSVTPTPFLTQPPQGFGAMLSPSGTPTPSPTFKPTAKPPFTPTEQGLCNDGVDNDIDGLIDADDQGDCPPPFVTQPPGFDPSTAGIKEIPPDPIAPQIGVNELLEERSPDLTLPDQDESDPILRPGQVGGSSSSLDTQLHPQSPTKGGGGSNNIDPGTNTVPAQEGPPDEKCVLLVFSCVEEPILDPTGAKPMELSDDEICRNGKDDNGNGRVDETPYCTATSDSAPECVEGEESAFFVTQDGKRISVPPCDTTLKPEQSTGPSPFG